MKSFIFQTLNNAIEEQVEKTICKNEYFLNNRWNFLEELSIRSSEHPIKSSFYIMMFFILVGLLIYQTTLIPQNYSFFTEQLSKKNIEYIIALNDLIFNAQITILALIFPLVVGFVGVLLKDEIAKQSLWAIYSRYSSFMLVGYCGLLLSSFLIAIKLFKPFLSDTLEMSIGVSLVLWFLFNLAMVAWLLYSTFSFINFKEQNNIITKFATNEIIIQQIKSRLYKLLPVNSVAFYLLPSIKSGKLGIEFFNIQNNFSATIEKEFKKNKYLNSINYTLLGMALRLLSYRLKKQTKTKVTIYLPTTGTSIPYENFLLAGLSDKDFLFYERWLIELSFSFSTKQKYREQDDLIISSLFNDIDKAMRDDNYRLYNQAVDNLQEYISTIFGVSSFQHEDGKIDNWLLLSDNSFFSISLLHEISKEFYSLNKSVIKNTLKNQEYFHNLCYFYQYTFNESHIKLHNNIKKDLLEAHAHLWDVLVESESLRMKPFFSELCKYFIGGWESWTRYTEKKLDTWEDAKERLIFDENYLMSTCQLILKADMYDNQEGTLWAINILNNWYENQFGLEGGHVYLFGWKETLLSTETLKMKQDNDALDFILNKNEMDLHSAYLVANKNRWITTCILTSILLIGKYGSDINKNKTQKLALLVYGTWNTNKVVNPLDKISSPGARINFIKVLETYILGLNQFTGTTKNYVYKSLIEYFQKISRKDVISGRAFGGIVDGLSSYSSAFKTLLLITYTHDEDIAEDIYDFFASDLFPLNGTDSLLNNIQLLTDIDEAIKDGVQEYTQRDNIDAHIEAYKKTVNKIVSKIKAKALFNLEEAEVSEEILQKIQTYCSSPTFAKESDDVPIKFFKTVEHKEELSDGKSFDLKYTEYNKERLLKSDFAHYLGEEKFHENTMERLSYYIFEDLFKLIGSGEEEKTFSEPREIVEALVKDSDNEVDKLILVFSRELASYIRKIRYSYKQEDIVYGVSYDIKDQYKLYIGTVEVYIINQEEPGYCLMVDKDVFEKLEIKQYKENIFVEVEFSPCEDDKTVGDLKITGEFRVTLNDTFDIKKYMLEDEPKLQEHEKLLLNASAEVEVPIKI